MRLCLLKPSLCLRFRGLFNNIEVAWAWACKLFSLLFVDVRTSTIKSFGWCTASRKLCKTLTAALTCVRSPVHLEDNLSSHRTTGIRSCLLTASAVISTFRAALLLLPFSVTGYPSTQTIGVGVLSFSVSK